MDQPGPRHRNEPADPGAADAQIVNMTESGSGYTPNEFTVKKGQPVHWVVTADAPYAALLQPA